MPNGDWRLGLVSEYRERRASTSEILYGGTYTWAEALDGSPYIATAYVGNNLGTANEKKSRVDHALDRYGNVLQKMEYDHGASSPSRTTNCSYVTDPAYISRYLRNLPLSCALTAGTQTFTLFTRTYDQRRDTQVPSGLRLHDGNYGTGFWTRGNVSDWTQLGGTVGTSLVNMTGQVTQSSIGTSSYQRITTSTYNAAYSAPNQLTVNSNSQIRTTLTFNAFLGLTQSAQANGTTKSITYDAYGRVATESTPDGQVTYAYTNSPPTKTATLGTRWTKTHFDGFGRVIKEETGDGSGTKSIVDTVYEPCACSPLGKVKRVSRPYAPGGTVYWTEYTYDALGRTVSVVQPGGSGTTTYAYAGSTTTVTDPGGRWKRLTTDAFGNVVQVNEPNPSGGEFVTTYAYNGLNKLTNVWMPRNGYTQTRTFVYNNQGQLTSETHPENGTMTYTYNNGLVASKTDAKGHRTEWNYDGYRRVWWERHFNGSTEIPCERIDYRYDSYSVTPPAGYGSQNVWGRLAEVKWGNENPVVCGAGLFTEQYGYDFYGQQNGKTIRFRRNEPNRPEFPNKGETILNARWGWAWGRIAGITYPSTWDDDGPVQLTTSKPGQVTEHTFDSMHRPNGLRMMPESSGPWQTAVAGVAYGVAGELTQMQYGGQTETRGYNVLGQLTGIS